MRFFDYIKTAFKNLRRQKSRTILTIIAIVIGSLSVIIMLSLVISARRVMIKQLESIGGFTLITVTGSENMGGGGNLFDVNGSSDSDAKKLDDAVVTQLKKMDHVAAATPVASIWSKAMKIEGSEKKTWPNVLGYEVGSSVFEVPIAYGRGLHEGDMDKVVVGIDILKNLGLDGNPKDVVGKKMIFILDGNNTPDWGPEPEKPPANADKDWWEAQNKISKEIKAEIVGVTSGGTDSRQSFISLDWARKMQTQVRWEFDDEARKKAEEAMQNQKKDNNNSNFNGNNFQKLVKEDMIEKNGYSAIMLKADNTKNVVSLGQNIKNLGYAVTTAEDMLKEIQKIFTMLGLLSGAIGGISLFVAAIGIINTMIMATYERTREIGVMRACGATKATIRKLFTFEASLLGFFGGVIGLLVSFGLAQVGNLVANKIATSESLPISNFITFPIWLIFGVIAFTTVIGLLSGLYPAHRAAKLDPVDALRYE